jgi:hypothetical protein
MEEEDNVLRAKVAAMLDSKQASLQSVANLISKRTRTLQSWLSNTDPDRSTHDDWNIRAQLLRLVLVANLPPTRHQPPPTPIPPSSSLQKSPPVLAVKTPQQIQVVVHFPPSATNKQPAPLPVIFPSRHTRFRYPFFFPFFFVCLTLSVLVYCIRG